MPIKTHLLIIDGQEDFTNPKGALFVPGGDADMSRLSAFIAANINKFDDIHATLDSHHQFQIFHPLYWRDAKGAHPAPFTQITVDDVEKGKWMTSVPSFRDKALDYVKALDANKRYALIIWPVHCLIGSWGTQVNAELFNALRLWENTNTGMVNFVTKGSNMFTEHYSAVKAEVPDPTDPSTQLNQGFVDMLLDADQILVAGEALDYCVKNTILDTADALGPDQARKIKILRDCTSAIDPNAIPAIEAEFKARGILFITTKDAF